MRIKCTTTLYKIYNTPSDGLRELEPCVEGGRKGESEWGRGKDEREREWERGEEEKVRVGEGGREQEREKKGGYRRKAEENPYRLLPDSLLRGCG